MELIGTNFAITLGSWRLSFRLALEDVDAPQPVKAQPHHVRVVRDEEYARRARAN
jgi:hypothetical protein